MSYSLKIVNGDLDLSSTTLGVISGLSKLTQDLSLWIQERYGVDRFHPDYGSIVGQYIGEIVNDTNTYDIQVEMFRILSIYQQIQVAAVQANPGKFSLDELLGTIEDVHIATSYDKLNIVVKFTTASGLPGVVSGEVTA